MPALSANQKRANALKIEWDKDTPDEKLAELIEAKEKQLEQDKEEKEIADENKRKAEDEKKKKIILRNIDGEDVDQKDYFYSAIDKATGKTTYAPLYFNRVCGMPVEDEDMISVFRKVFGEAAPEFLFYKCKGQEVYIVIVPLRRATVVGDSEDSLPGDFQKHSISFIAEGSVNLETLKMKLKKISGFLKRSE